MTKPPHKKLTDKDEKALDAILAFVRAPERDLTGLEQQIVSDFVPPQKQEQERTLWFSGGMVAAGFAIGVLSGMMALELLRSSLSSDAPLVAFLEMPLAGAVIANMVVP